jgi:hypothetical protein
VLLVVLVAVAAFWMAEVLERRLAPGPALEAAPVTPRRRRLRALGAGALLLAAATGALRGEPGAEERWRRQPARVHQLVADRAMFADPAEVVALRKDTSLRVEVLDLRAEHDFNLFHVGGARRVDPRELDAPAELRRLREREATTVTFLAGNGEERSLEAWKRLAAQGVPNVYVVAGGVNRWLDLYPPPACVASRRPDGGPDDLAFRFEYAAGASLPSAWPELPVSQEFRFPCGEERVASGRRGHGGVTWPNHPFAKHVKLQTRAAVKGGCG